MAKLGLDWAELQACWEKVRDSGHFTEGYFIKAFEDEVSRWCGLHAVAFNSAGSGLFAMARCSSVLGSSGGDALVPNNTFFATGAMMREGGYRALTLVDCNKTDLCMSHDAMQRLMGTATLAVLTHVGGGLATDYQRISRACIDRGMLFFEDAAHAFGVGTEGSTAGSASDGAVFSLYPTKAVPVGEGGVVVTKHQRFASRLREFRNYGKRVVEGVIQYDKGFNLRMDEWTAAVAYLQTKRLGEIVEKRDAAAWCLSKVIMPMQLFGPGRSNWYKYAVSALEAADLGLKRFTGKVYQRSDQLAAALGISYQGPFPNSDWVADNHVCLPIDEDLYYGMSKDDILLWLRSAP